MKYLITSILLLFFIPLFGQESKVIEKVDDYLYEYRAYNEDGSVHQKGMYIESEDGKLLVHSYWRDDVGTKALYNRGKLVWIKPKGQPRYTYEEIEFEKMKHEIEQLKRLVASNK